MTELKAKHDRYKCLQAELIGDSKFTQVDDSDPRWKEFNELTIFFQGVRAAASEQGTVVHNTFNMDGIANNISPQKVLPKPEDNAITEVEVELQYIRMSRGRPPLTKTNKKRYYGLLLIQEVIPWVNAQYPSQVEHITVKSIKVFLGGTASKCNIKVR